MQIRAYRSVNLWTAALVQYPFGLVHVEKDANATVPDDVAEHPGYDLLVQEGDIVVLQPPSGGGGGGEPTPPEGTPTETTTLNMPMNDTDNDIVALHSQAKTVQAGDPIRVGSAEYMTVIDASDPNNLKVTRGSFGSTLIAHTAGEAVAMWGTAPVISASKVAAAKPGKK